MKNSITTPTVKLRAWMKQQGLQAFVIPTADPHHSEYLPDHWKTREWATGFTGSAGLAVITDDDARLWTDSRYYLQAEEQLAGTPFTLMREGEPGVPSPSQWLGEVAGKTCLKMGYVAETMACSVLKEFQVDNVVPVAALEDPFEVLWKDRPPLPSAPVCVQPLLDAGESVQEKLLRVRSCVWKEKGVKGYFLNDLSEIAWLLNIRGGDVDYNPFVLAYLLLTRKDAVLFADAGKFSPQVMTHLETAGVKVWPYDGWKKHLDIYADEPGRILMPESMNCAVADKLAEVNAGEKDSCILASPVPMMRAVKNEAEIEGFRRAMVRDGVAMVRFLRRFDEALSGGEKMSECDVDGLLTSLRAEGERFCSLSFPTIAAYGGNGAVVHYEPERGNDSRIEPRGLLLLDSGAQYEDGTTDITRTIVCGPLTAEEKRVFTWVLNAHIALSMGRYPEGATGLQIDAVGRQHLWEHGYDFGHGTGHGVGSRLGVHEGPHQIRKDVRDCTLVPFRSGMVVTNEPGIYEPGKFGVRLENVLLALPAETTPFGRFFRFETLTLCPYDRRAICVEELPKAHVEWLNAYHQKVRKLLMPLLTDKKDRLWLEKATEPL